MTAITSTERAPATGTSWPTVVVLAAAGFLALAVELSPAGLLTRIAPDLDASVAAAGSLTALYSLGNAVLVLPLTALAVRFDRRAVLAATLVVFVLGNLLVMLADGLPPALTGRFVSGGAHGLLMALSPAVAMRMVPQDQSQKALSLVVGANTLGIALGAPLTSVVGTNFGWRVTFAGAAAVALLAAAVLFKVMPRVADSRTQPVSLLGAVRLPGVLRLAGAYALLMLAYMAVITYIDPLLTQRGAPPLVVSASLTIFGGAGILGVWLGGRLLRRSRHLALVTITLLTGLAYLLLFLISGPLGLVLGLLALWGVGFAGGVLVAQEVVLHVGFRARETVTSISVVMAQLGMAVGSALGGVVVETAGVGATPALGLAAVGLALLLVVGSRGVLDRATAAQAVTDQTRRAPVGAQQA
jgi:predicted MFS family arabinose efflux permease